ncbi:ABC transporter permease [Phenylobacterium sp.]|uniref:ABC transporter permease n=1 Tax=Phenylobacterium sp. TaxID=1871053 RepID=UPI002731C434|nr:FtsX-like permease family protein [Phenylobacterium sp.]MDP1615829.1 ABC transporter permease [Phenylobacterium sp.]MDP1986888.1 ABC transporter permease [Phenylobacterium sp.]
MPRLSLALSPLLLRWMVGGEWRARPGRVLVAVLAIAVGVGLGLAVHLVNRSALDSFAQAVSSVSGAADVQIEAASPSGFDEALYPQVARTPGVATASPVVELAATSPGGSLTLLGLDPLRAYAVTPSLLGQGSGASPTTGSDALFDLDTVHLSPAALAATGLAVGDQIPLTAAGRTAEFRIVGTLEALGDNRPLAVIDIAAAQWRFGQLGRLQRIDVRLVPGADRSQVEAALRAGLPDGADLVTAQSEMRRTESLSRAYRVNLQMLALVALLTGGFLVYSAQSLSVARRRPQFALLRVLGLPARGMLGQVLIEGLILGLIGSALGVAFGYGLAELALRLLGGDLGGGYFAGERPQLSVAPVATVVIFTLGLAIALAGSLWPALEAERTPAAVALKAGSGDAPDPGRLRRPWISLALLVVGMAAALAPPVGGLPLFGYVAIALMLAGGAGAMPWLARTALQPLRHLKSPPAPLALAIARLWGAPRQAAVALSGIVASTSLMVAMAVMVTSFRGSVDEWLTQILPADIYMRMAEGAALDPDLQARLATAPEVASIEFRDSFSLRLDPERPAVQLIARGSPGADPAHDLPLVGRTATPPAGATPTWISEPMAQLYKLASGDRLVLPLRDGAEVQVIGVWRDYSNQFGALIVDQAAYTRLTGEVNRREAAIVLAADANPQQAIAALRERLPADLASQASFAEPRELRAVALRIFDRSFAITYALEAIAILVGLTGVAATFSAQTLARRKEFGVLRHLGVRRGQIVGMLAAEGALLGLIGAAAGLALGVGMSQILIHVVNPQSFNWTMETRLPWSLLAGLGAALALTSAGTAVLAGRGALSDSAVRAVREDW